MLLRIHYDERSEDPLIAHFEPFKIETDFVPPIGETFMRGTLIYKVISRYFSLDIDGKIYYTIIVRYHT